jgi:hypothetical protein
MGRVATARHGVSLAFHDEDGWTRILTHFYKLFPKPLAEGANQLVEYGLVQQL